MSVAATAALAAQRILGAAAAASDDGHQADEHQDNGNDNDGDSDATNGVSCNLDAGKSSVVAAMLELQAIQAA